MRGGLLLLADGSLTKYDASMAVMLPADPTPGADNSNRCWMQYCLLESIRRMPCAPDDRCGGDYVGTLIRDDPQFEYLGERSYIGPVSWAGEGIANGSEIGQLQAQNTLVRIDCFQLT